MKKFFFLLFGVIFSYLVQAQESRWGITYTPALLNGYTIRLGIQPGFEYRFNERWNLVTEFAFMTGRKDTSAKNNRFFRLKSEIRHQLGLGERTLKPYAGLQVFYALRSWTLNSKGSYFENKPYEDSAMGYSHAKIQSPVYSSSLQLGSLISFSDRFHLDVFMGMGVRVIDTRYSDVVYTHKYYNIRPVCTVLITPDPAWWVDGTVTRFQLNLGLRFLYRFE